MLCQHGLARGRGSRGGGSLTLAVVFVVMEAAGINFDRVTLGSLILALGLLVDDAIIAIEMMVVKMEEGYDRIKASAYAWSHTAAPCWPVPS